MISEKVFSEYYTSFWHSALPLEEPYVRHANLLLKDYAQPVRVRSRDGLHAVVSELGFRFFIHRQSGLDINDRTRAELIEDVVAYISRFPRSEEVDLLPTEDEVLEAMEIGHSLIGFVEGNTGFFVGSPEFSGCGIVDKCVGDFVQGRTLYEVKAVQRKLRSTDFRQLLTYCALNSQDNRFEIERVGIVNPRRGSFFVVKLMDLSRFAGGRSYFDLLGEMVDFFSSEGRSGGF